MAADPSRASLAASRAGLLEAGYIARRMLGFEAAWLLALPTWSGKITLGHALHFTAECVQLIDARLDELMRGYRSFECSSTRVRAVLDAAALAPIGRIEVTVGELTSILRAVLEELATHVDPLADAPSLRMLASARASLNAKADWLRARDWPLPDARSFARGPDGGVQRYSEECSTPVVPASPGRPAGLVRSPESILTAAPAQLVGSREGLARLWHFIYADIEVCAAETCAKNIAAYGAGMPVAFSADMARQCSDEARHALMAERHLLALDGRLGQFTYTNAVWLECERGESLAERLAIEQVIAEGNGLDGAVLTLAAMRAAGLDAMAADYEFLMADETQHTAFGLRWMALLLGNDVAAQQAIVQRCLERSGKTMPPKIPVDAGLRREAGYPDWYFRTFLAA